MVNIVTLVLTLWNMFIELRQKVLQNLKNMCYLFIFLFLYIAALGQTYYWRIACKVIMCYTSQWLGIREKHTNIGDGLCAWFYYKLSIKRIWSILFTIIHIETNGTPKHIMCICEPSLERVRYITSKSKSKSKSKKTLFNVGQCKQYNISSHLEWVLVADKSMHMIIYNKIHIK